MYNYHNTMNNNIIPEDNIEVLNFIEDEIFFIDEVAKAIGCIIIPYEIIEVLKN